jgi:hypothetical protein
MTTKKKPFHEYTLEQLRELELTSSMLSQVREKYRVACRRRCILRDKIDDHERHDPNRRRVLACHIALQRAEVRAFSLDSLVTILERRRAILSDEITRAVVVHALRGIFRGVFGYAISGAEIARRYWDYRDLRDAIGMTDWLRNVDFAREAKLWTMRKDFTKPPKLSNDYVDRILTPQLLGLTR